VAERVKNANGALLSITILVNFAARASFPSRDRSDSDIPHARAQRRPVTASGVIPSEREGSKKDFSLRSNDNRLPLRLGVIAGDIPDFGYAFARQ
jgi:hypothetical protein